MLDKKCKSYIKLYVRLIMLNSFTFLGYGWVVLNLIYMYTFGKFTNDSFILTMTVAAVAWAFVFISIITQDYARDTRIELKYDINMGYCNKELTEVYFKIKYGTAIYKAFLLTFFVTTYVVFSIIKGTVFDIVDYIILSATIVLLHMYFKTLDYIENSNGNITNRVFDKITILATKLS